MRAIWEFIKEFGPVIMLFAVLVVLSWLVYQL